MKNETIVIFGITGDLSKRKIIPALYELVRQGFFKGHIFGTGLEDAERFSLLREAAPFIKNRDPRVDQEIESLFIYQKLHFDQNVDFIELEKKIRAQEKAAHLSGGRLAYLATAADFFCTVTRQLVESRIIEPHNNNYRIAYEKPFGCDLESAHAINMCIHDLLSESQIYRIDHYLAKEFVNNILILRSTNILFKSAWNNKSIRAVKILLHEDFGIAGRGAFYDKYGALKDVVQNHLLQLLALVAMDAPASLDWQEIRSKKAELLKAVRVVTGILGQYEGYCEEENVRKDSTTETYAAVKLIIDDPVWEGVPFYLETGKALASKTTEVRVMFKPVAQCVWSEDCSQECAANMLTIYISPREGFSLALNVKKPGTLQKITGVNFNFCDKPFCVPESTEAYELLLREILEGRHSMTVRFDEIEYQWALTEKIYDLDLPVLSYAKGSNGPQAGELLMEEM